ncbi:TonB-dependent receptor [Spongiibacter taiwanensis]|uniref:TonB-dependent receptor n=1 Tax=Spongiibacter taiwanensis TaxID=1748242 RepID=UPI002036121C|nr:TonB-dependent receptor [Spongiibacter taiwanensis]USA42182.1 TonB-dependent receptor [Spongiibacter taiwanensis]
MFLPPRPFATALATLLPPLASTVVYANEPPHKIEEVVVTGDLLQRQTLETVSSISVVSEQQIAARNIRDLYDLLLRTPNVNAAKEDKFSVRGISNEGIGPGGTGRPTVSVFIDGARQPGRGVGNTWDIEQVAFYRGPQSTAFGPGSLAGAIVLKSKDPSHEEYSGHLKVGAANDYGREVGVAVGGPLVGGFAFRYAAETNQTDGEVTNTTLNDDQWQARDRYLQRAKLAWEGVEWYSAMLTYQQTKLREGNEYLPPERAESRQSTDNVDGFYNDNSELLLLKQNIRFSDQLDLEILTSRSESDNARKGDYDISEEDRGQFVNVTKIENRTLEMRLHMRPDWGRGVLGAYFSEDELTGSSVNTGVPYSLSGAEVKADADLLAARSADTKALYGEADIDLTQRLTLTVGARHEQNDASNRSAFIVTGAQLIDPVTGSPVPGDVSPLLKPLLDSDATAPSDDTVFLPKLALSYQFTDSLSSFITAVRGYRAGSVDFVSDGESPTYGPEYTTNIDLGVKMAWQTWYAQASLFRVDYDDMQVGTRVDASTFRTDNAGEARAQGVELEFSGELGAGFSLFGGIGYTDTKFVDYQDDDVDFSGNEFPNAPQLTANLTLQYQHHLGWFADLSWARTDGSFTDRENTPFMMADARDLLGARFGWEGEHVTLEVYGQNLTDEFYITDRFASSSLGINAVFVGDPKEYGARLRYRF